MIQMEQRFRLPLPSSLFRTVPPKVTQRRLRNLTMVSIVLVLLMFAVQSDASIFGRPFTTGVPVSSSDVTGIAYQNLLSALQRQRSIAWQRHLLVKQSPATRKNASMGEFTTGLTVSTEVLRTAAGPEQVSILTFDLTSASLQLGVVQAYNRLISPAETLSSMANRTGAVAGINGDFFEIHGSDVPIGEEVINGQLLHSPNPQFYAVLGVTPTGRLTIGPEYFSGEVTDGHASYRLYSINHYSEINNARLVLFTAALGEPVYVGGDPVAFIRPVAGSADFFTVQSVSSSVTWLPALSNQDVLLAACRRERNRGHPSRYASTRVLHGRAGVTERSATAG